MGETDAEMEMKTLAALILVPLTTLALMIAAEQEETTTFDSGACPDYPDHDAAWYEYDTQR